MISISKRFPKSFFSASSLSTIFKFFLGINLLIFNKLIYNVIEPKSLDKVIFFVHLFPLIITILTVGLKVSIQKNVIAHNHQTNINNLSYFFSSYIITTLFSFPLYFLIFGQENNLINFFVFYFFCITVVSYQLIISILIGARKFFFGNLFGGIPLNGFLFGFSLNSILYNLSISNSQINLSQFLQIISSLSFILLVFILVILKIFSIPNNGKIKIFESIKNGFLIFSKEISDIASFNLDLIFIRIFIGEHILYLYTTISSLARTLLMPKQIFSPILIPFIHEAFSNKDRVKNVHFLRDISKYGTFISSFIFIIYLLLFNSGFDFYRFDNDLYYTAFSVFIILSLSNIFMVAFGYAGVSLIVLNEEKAVFKIASYCLMFFIIMLIISSNFLSIIGVVISVFIFDLLKNLFYTKYLFNHYKIKLIADIF